MFSTKEEKTSFIKLRKKKGLNLEFSIAIDFTASNGPPKFDDNSLHKIKDGFVNKKTLKLPLRDADEEEKSSPDYKGMMFFNAKSKRRPQIVDRHKEALYSDDEIYSGCYCNVMVNFYAFAMEGNKGIAAGLGNIQKVKDGDRLGFGGTAANDDFDDYEDEVDDL